MYNDLSSGSPRFRLMRRGVRVYSAGAAECRLTCFYLLWLSSTTVYCLIREQAHIGIGDTAKVSLHVCKSRISWKIARVLSLPYKQPQPKRWTVYTYSIKVRLLSLLCDLCQIENFEKIADTLTQNWKLTRKDVGETNFCLVKWSSTFEAEMVRKISFLESGTINLGHI